VLVVVVTGHVVDVAREWRRGEKRNELNELACCWWAEYAARLIFSLAPDPIRFQIGLNWIASDRLESHWSALDCTALHWIALRLWVGRRVHETAMQ